MSEAQFTQESLPVLFQSAVEDHGRLQSLSATTDEFKVEIGEEGHVLIF
jgi:hypothetical protein